MKENSYRSPLYSRMIAIFKSKRSRNFAWLLLIIFSILSMFCIDEQNYIRNEYLSFLNDNIVSDTMAKLSIARYNVTSSSWVLFSALITVAIMMLVGNIIAPKYIDKKVAKNYDLFSSESKVRWFYSILFYGTLFIIAAIIVLIAYLLNAFALYHANTQETSPFISLLTMLSIFLSILLAIPVALLIIYAVIKFVLLVLSYMFGSVFYFNQDIKTARQEEIKQTLKDIRFETTAVAATAGAIPYSNVSSADGTQDLFPTLTAIDNANQNKPEPTVSDDITLEDFVKRFQSYAINKHNIYYELSLLRQFVAGLAASRLVILEGLSGTGKSMLPRMFKEFTGSDALFTPVQATWRDKTDVLGFYSEFTGSFKATAFLEKLYAASYSDKLNLFILDEMNLSRVEYYFADFLSVMEYPEEDWKVKAYLPFDNRALPAKLEGGFITIPNNAWFVGTANTDDSTFTITDKVCDRAIILNFEDRFAKMESNADYEPITVSAPYLKQLFETAMNDENNKLDEKDLKKFNSLCEYIKDKFDILFGNRIMVQIEKFVPVYVALGGTKEEALDFMFAKKILRKLEGKYETYLKDELVALKGYINSLYGKGVFKETESFIDKTVKKLG